MERVDVAVVGGGPAGAAAGHAAADQGAQTVVLEKGVPRADRDGVGPDSTDAAGILDYWVDLMRISPEEFPEGVLQQELDRAEFHGPSESCTLYSTGISSSYDKFGFTFHRARFDDWMRNRAEAAGAEYRIGAAVREVNVDTGSGASGGEPRHVLHLATGGQIGADALILADGPQRTVTNRVLDELLPESYKASDVLAAPRANHIAYQEYRRFPPEVYEEVSGAIEFWWGVMPGHTAYPWVFPNADRVCRVGLTMPIGLDLESVKNHDEYALIKPEDESVPSGGEYIHRLLEREYGDEYDVESDFPLVEDAGKSGGTETYPISSTRPIDSPTGVDIAVVGGAMGSTSAFHEGGDHLAVRTGAEAGRLAATGELQAYNDRWKAAVGDELLRNVTLAEMCRGYGPRDWDHVFRTARKMLASERGLRMFDRKFAAGLSATRLLLGYKYRKFRFRDGRYVQLRESRYTY